MLRSLVFVVREPAGPRIAGACSRRLVSGFHSSSLLFHEKEKENRGDEGRENVHFRLTAHRHPLDDPDKQLKKQYWDNPFGNHVWSDEEVNAIKVEKKKPLTRGDAILRKLVNITKFNFDLFSGYSIGKLNEEKVLRRIIFLETIAGVPGMCAAMLRHLKSLRTMERDRGFIFSLLEEAENERMHLLTFMQIGTPGPFFRLMVVLAQGVFMNAFFISYIISPKLCHRFVGYIEEDAVETYTKIIKHLDNGDLPKWNNKPAPQIAINYWKLNPDATMRDLLLQVRADEANHRDTNHVFAETEPGEPNPLLANHHPKK